jgi:hypothetical protein
MIAWIKNFFKQLWSDVTSIFSKKAQNPVTLTNEEKYDFVMSLLKGQINENTGFALRHVDDEEIKTNNISHGFRGDAISYSVTDFILSTVLEESVEIRAWNISESNQVKFIYDAGENKNKFMDLDQSLAVRIFDCLHEKILSFIAQNFSGMNHHFMFIENMGGMYPYDIKDIYPTGKCGKQNVNASQIKKVFSKNENMSIPEEMLFCIEKGVLQSSNKNLTKHHYSQESTTAIVSVLREIKFLPAEKKLERADVQKRLISAECEFAWSDSKHERFFDKANGYWYKFNESLNHVNDDLGYFNSLVLTR